MIKTYASCLFVANVCVHLIRTQITNTQTTIHNPDQKFKPLDSLWATSIFNSKRRQLESNYHHLPLKAEQEFSTFEKVLKENPAYQNYMRVACPDTFEFHFTALLFGIGDDAFKKNALQEVSRDFEKHVNLPHQDLTLLFSHIVKHLSPAIYEGEDLFSKPSLRDAFELALLKKQSPQAKKPFRAL
jgi:hypothetical protein